MKNPFSSLNDAEIDWLDRFLLDRIDEGADTEGKDEGVLDISELDGLFTALVSGPVMIPPSRWLPAVWGDFEPTWESAEDFENVISLMIRHMNGIAATLMEQPEDFAPIFLEREVEGNIYSIVDEWCEGYMRGVALAVDAWNAGGQPMTVLLTPIRAFTSETGWRAHDMSSPRRLKSNISGKRLFPTSARSMPGGWRAVSIMRLLQHPPAVPNRVLGATIPAPVAVARNTRCVVCTDARTLPSTVETNR